MDSSPQSPSAVKWDFFLSHARADTSATDTLFEALVRLRVKPYFDKRSLDPGDPWSNVLPAMLKASSIVVILISPNTANAPYQDSEIRLAIDLVRDFPERYRVIGVLLDMDVTIRRTELPFGLERTTLLSWRECGGVDSVATRLVQMLSRAPNTAPSPHAHPMLADATAAFVGEMAWGPLQPVLLTQWSDYTAIFARPLEVERSFTATALRGFFENGGTRVYAVRVASSFATKAAAVVKTTDDAQSLLVSARHVGSFGNDIRLRIEPASRRGVRLTIYLEGERGYAEDYDNLSWIEGDPNPMLERVNGRSEWVQLQWSCDGPTAPPESGDWILAGGADGILQLEDFAGQPAGEAGPGTGIEALAELDEASVLFLPDAVHPRFVEAEQAELTQRIVSLAERSHRLAILSTSRTSLAAEYPTAPNESSHAFAVAPWVEVADIVDPGDNEHGGTRLSTVPAVGHVAGLLARHDASRGVHESPRGELVTGVRSERPGPSLSTLWTVDACARRGVNLLAPADDPADGLQLRTAVTCAIDEAWIRLEVRRTINFIYRRLAAATTWVTFEPNDERTWAQLRLDVEDFFTDLWRAGVLVGGTPAQAFFVRCGRDTMTDDDIANGRLIYLCGLSLPPGTPSPELPVLNARPAVALRGDVSMRSNPSVHR